MKQKSWISIVFSFASQCRGKIVLSVLCAIISVVAGLIPYWSVYQIITLFIGGSPVMAEVRWGRRRGGTGSRCSGRIIAISMTS